MIWKKNFEVCGGISYFADAYHVRCTAVLPEIHTRAVEAREQRLAEEEFAANQTEMNDLTLAVSDMPAEEHESQLKLRLPEGVGGEAIQYTNDYVTQTIRIEIPGTDSAYFDSYPIMGSSNHIGYALLCS